MVYKAKVNIFLRFHNFSSYFFVMYYFFCIFAHRTTNQYYCITKTKKTMRKFFTLIAVSLLTIGAYAQGTFALTEGATPDPDTPVTSVNGITLTYPHEGTWLAAAAYANKADADFTAYTKGNGVSGAFTEGSAPTGCYYEFAPTADGTLTVAICANAEKPFYVVAKNNGAYTALEDSKLTIMSDASTTATLNENHALAAKIYGTVAFDVTAGETYDVLITGSKLGFFGFKFATSSSTAIKTVATAEQAANTAVYNLAGQRVNKSFKGLVISNGKKFIR